MALRSSPGEPVVSQSWRPVGHPPELQNRVWSGIPVNQASRDCLASALLCAAPVGSQPAGNSSPPRAPNRHEYVKHGLARPETRSLCTAAGASRGDLQRQVRLVGAAESVRVDRPDAAGVEGRRHGDLSYRTMTTSAVVSIGTPAQARSVARTGAPSAVPRARRARPPSDSPRGRDTSWGGSCHER